MSSRTSWKCDFGYPSVFDAWFHFQSAAWSYSNCSNVDKSSVVCSGSYFHAVTTFSIVVSDRMLFNQSSFKDSVCTICDGAFLISFFYVYCRYSLFGNLVIWWIMSVCGLVKHDSAFSIWLFIAAQWTTSHFILDFRNHHLWEHFCRNW